VRLLLICSYKGEKVEMISNGTINCSSQSNSSEVAGMSCRTDVDEVPPTLFCRVGSTLLDDCYGHAAIDHLFCTILQMPIHTHVFKYQKH
jgi:hypothetical protein